MIVGNDVSNFQDNIDWATYSRNTNFVIAKATEGVGYIDTWFGNNRHQARQYNLLRGWYHFARPDLGNTPQSEAQFFLNVLAGDPLQWGEILALDYEVTYHDPVLWCKTFLDYIANNVGCKPLIYLNQSLSTSYDWKPVVDAGYGLWIAAYSYDPTKNDFQIGAWPFAAMQQWTDKQQVPGILGNVDGDVFFSDANAFVAYGYIPPVVAIPVSQQVSTPPVQPPTTGSASTGTQPVTVVSSQPTPVLGTASTVTIPMSSSETTVVKPSPRKDSIFTACIRWLIVLLQRLI